MEQRQLFAVDGLFCAGCARGLEKRLADLDGVVAAGVHFVTASALVRWDPVRCDPQAISRRVGEAGYRLIERQSLADTAARFDREVKRLALRLAVAVVFGMWSMGAALILYVQPDIASPVAWWIALASGLFALPVLGYSGAAIFRMAWRSIGLRAPGLDLLIATGAGGAVLLSTAALVRGQAQVYFDTATMLVTLLLLGRLIETRVRRTAIQALSAVDDLAANQAVALADGGSVELRQLAIGTLIAVDAGAVIPGDGVVIEGESLIDRSIMTGEAMASAIGPDDRVQAGTTNLRRRLMVRVDRAYGDRDIDRMGGRIALEIAGRGEPRRALDQWIARLLAAAPAWSALAFLIAFALGASPVEAMTRALATLIVICPCALAIAAPLAHVRAAGVAARRGIRIADPAALEALAGMRTAIFDKTGTLTLARLRVDLVEPIAPVAREELLEAAAAAERGIDHPIARALTDGADGPAGNRFDRSAAGVDLRGRDVAVSSANDACGDGRTWLDVMIDGRHAGRIGLADTLDQEAPATIAELHAAGIEVRLATGDGVDAALSVAGRVGVPQTMVAAGCTPLDKAKLVAAVLHPVIVIGDGVNDAPALAAADCGITVARAHAAAAATAGLVLEVGGIGTVLPAWRLARRTQHVITQNFVLATGYNIVAVPLAVLGLMTPLVAAAAMVASSCLVTMNAMRLN